MMFAVRRHQDFHHELAEREEHVCTFCGARIFDRTIGFV
jgi:hypothetical protein